MPGFFDDLDTDPMAGASTEEIKRNAHMANGGEQAFVACRKCNGTGWWRAGYRCFTCKGGGKVTKRQAGAAKAQDTRKANHAQWVADHREMLTTLQEFVEWNSFAAAMVQQVADGQKLTDNQREACLRMIAKVEAKREEKRAAAKAAANSKSGEVGVEAIHALFAKATDNDIKRPIFRADGVEISKAPLNGRNAGALYVKDEETDAYLGKIVGNQFLASREATSDTLQRLKLIAVDPTAAAIRYGRRTGRCGCCGRTLVDPVSIRSAVGPICADKWGLDWRREDAREQLAQEAMRA